MFTVALVAQYLNASSERALVGLFAYVLAAMTLATFAGAQRAPWWLALLLGAVLAALAYVGPPQKPLEFNLLVAPLAHSAAAAFSLGVALWFVQRRFAPPARPLAPWTSPALTAAAGAFALAGLEMLTSLDPAGFAMLAGAVPLALAAALAVVRARRRLVAAGLAVLALPLPILVLSGVLLATRQVAGAYRYEIPVSFSGEARIVWERPECPVLSRDGVQLVVPFDERGCACTSSAPPEGAYHETYIAVVSEGRRELRVTAWGGGGEIWGGSLAPRQQAHPYPLSDFFVGTEADSSAPGAHRRAECPLER